MIVSSRRRLLTGLLAAPAVVAIDRLMPVRSIERFLPYETTVWQMSVGPRAFYDWEAQPGMEIIGLLHGKWVSVRDIQMLGNNSTIEQASLKRRGMALIPYGDSLWLAGIERDTGRRFYLDNKHKEFGYLDCEDV